MEVKNKNGFLWTVILVLIIIIIILCLTKCCKKDEKYEISTGNVDIFNIDIHCKSNDSCPSDNNGDNKDNNGDIPVFNEDDDKILGKIFVDDQNGNYIYQQNLNIFNNAAFEYTNKIAPGVSNTYNFKTNNTSNKDFTYYVEMYEESEYKINLKYRLKRNGSYVVGNDSKWVTAEELKTEYTRLNHGESDNYSLEWKWFDDNDALDNAAGENMTSEYKLNIRFYFKAIDD